MLDSAPNTLNSDMLERVNGLMLTAAPERQVPQFKGDSLALHDALGDYDFSLARQLAAVSLDAIDHAYVFTAFSAIPVADTIRGLHDELGFPPPRLTYIDVKPRTSTGSDMRYSLDRLLGIVPKDKEQSEALVEETARLKKALYGISVVSVIDQYTCTGATLQVSKCLLEMAGINDVIGIAGRWYHDASVQGIDIRNLTSVFAQPMHSTGTKLAALQVTPVA